MIRIGFFGGLEWNEMKMWYFGRWGWFEDFMMDMEMWLMGEIVFYCFLVCFGRWIFMDWDWGFKEDEVGFLWKLFL